MRAAFTLLETMLAVAILAILSLAVYRFTAMTVDMAHLGSREAERAATCAGLNRLLQTQLDQLPARDANALRGIKGSNGDDQLTLLCLPGNGLLARSGAQRLCTLKLRRSTSELGLSRLEPQSNGQNLQSSTVSDADNSDGDWVPLFPGIQSLEITYFSARLNGWLPRWTDANALPDLVRVKLGFADGQEDYETTLHVPLRGQIIVNLPVAPVNAAQSPGAVSSPANPVIGAPGRRPLSNPEN